MTGSVLFLASMACVVGAGIWFGKRLTQANTHINDCISATLAGIDCERWDNEMAEGVA